MVKEWILNDFQIGLTFFYEKIYRLLDLVDTDLKFLGIMANNWLLKVKLWQSPWKPSHQIEV